VVFFLADCVNSICAKRLKIRLNTEFEEPEEGGHSRHATFWTSEAAPLSIPRFNKLLDQHLSPDIDQVARALARKFRWRIQPSGATALNFLGLSTQVPALAVYLSDGPDRVYQVGNMALAFEHTALKESGVKLKESGLIVQALKSLGQEQITPEVIAKIRAWLPESLRAKVLADTKTATGWAYSAIQQITQEEFHG